MVNTNKMRKYILFVAILFLVGFDVSNAQTDTIGMGVYLTNSDFLKNLPWVQDSFQIKPKVHKSKYSLFRIKSLTKKVNAQFIKYYAWGIYDGHDLYLNCYRIVLKPGYTRVEELGRYLYFTAPPLMNLSQESSIENAALLFGAVGGDVAAINANNKIHDKTNYIIDVKSGVPHLLDKTYLKWILKSEQDLLDLYDQEKRQEDLSTQRKYIRMLNERYK